MRTIAFLFVFLFFISMVSAACEEGQIDINIASLEEVMKIKHLGGEGIIAQRVIDARPFNSLDDLRRVSGLGGTGSKVEDIKEEGLACVNGIENQEQEEPSQETRNETQQENLGSGSQTQPQAQSQTPTQIQSTSQKESAEALETINLNPKPIKTEKSSKNYALYGFIAFVVLLGFLFIIRKNRYKNEFR